MHGWIWLGQGIGEPVTRAGQQHHVKQLVLASKRQGRQADGRKPPWAAPGGVQKPKKGVDAHQA
eukprot:12005307-Prorocentrum_lima.AAC.1